MLDRLERIFRELFQRKLKIGIITYNYPIDRAEIAGSSMHTYNLSRNLAALGCEVHVFCSGPRDRLVRKRIGEGKLIVHSLGVNIPYDPKKSTVSQKLHWYTFETRALNMVMYENSKRWFDIIHSQGWSSTAFMLKHFSKMNWIHTFHSLSKKRLSKMTKKESKFIPVHDWVEKTVVDADRIITVSEKFREEVIREMKGIARKTKVIPNGVNLDLFKPLRNNPKTVLYVGRFSKEKGIEMIPEIAEKVLKKDKRYKFIVAAAMTDLEELKWVAEKFNEYGKEYPGRFIWYKEPLNEEKIAALHRESSVYIQPSLYETFGMCVLEAMATGKGIVITNVGGMPELIGKTGLVSKPNAKEFSRKVLKLLEDNQLRKKYGKLCIEKAKQYDWKKIAKQTLNLYQEVIEENKEKREDEERNKK